MAAAAAGRERWRGNRAGLAGCGEPPRTRPFQSLRFGRRCHVGAAGVRLLLLQRRENSRDLKLVPLVGASCGFMRVCACVCALTRVMPEPAPMCFMRDGSFQLCWIPPVTHTHSGRCKHSYLSARNTQPILLYTRTHARFSVCCTGVFFNFFSTGKSMTREAKAASFAAALLSWVFN